MDADGETDADAEPDGLILALADTLGDTDGEADALAETEGDLEADGETDAEAELDGEIATPGFVVSLRIRPSNLVVIGVDGNDPSDASAMHVNVRWRMLPASVAACVIVPGMGA